MSDGIDNLGLDFDQLDTSEPSQGEIINCLCEVLEEVEQNSENFSEFLGLLSDIEEDVRESFKDVKQRTNSLERLLKKKLTVKNKLQDRLDRINEFQNDFEDGLNDIVAECPPGKTLLDLLSQVKGLITQKIDSIDEQIRSSISDGFGQIDQQLQKVSKALSTLDKLKKC